MLSGQRVEYRYVNTPGSLIHYVEASAVMSIVLAEPETITFFQLMPPSQLQGGVFECHLRCELGGAACDIFFISGNNICNTGLQQPTSGPGVTDFTTAGEYYKKIP